VSIVAGGLPAGTVNASIKTAMAKPRAFAFGPGGYGYFAGSTGSKELGGWHPLNRTPDSEVLQSKEKVTARARDLDRNNGWAIGGLDKRADAVIGANIRLRAKPDWQALGLTPEWADDFARQAESIFRTWGNDDRFLNDVERHQSFGAQTRLAYMHFVRDGAACAPLYWITDRGGLFATAALLLDPLRLSNPDGRPDGLGMDGVDIRGGVELDAYGAARAYHVRDAHPYESGWAQSHKWTRIPRETPTGRPLFVHAINKRFAHQHHSLSRLAAAMPSLRTLDVYQRSEVAAQIVNAVFGMYISSPFDSDFVREAMAPVGDGDGDLLGSYQDQRMAYHEKADITMDGVRLAHLFPNEKIETISGARSATNYEAFTRAELRKIASVYGLSGEQLSNDWKGINYSNARTLLNEVQRGFLTDRHIFTQSYCSPIYGAVIEEAVARDLLEVPGGKQNFYRIRTALTAADWIGPGRGWIDPKKEAEAAALRISMGISSQTDEAAEQGKDADEVRWQRKRDLEQDRKYGLTPIDPNAGAEAGGNNDDPDQTDRDDEREAAGDDE